MDNPAGIIAQADAPDAEPTGRKFSRLECLGGVITSPIRTFEHLASHPQWLFPLIVICLYVLVMLVVRMVVMGATMFMPSRVFGEEGIQWLPLFMSVFSSGILFSIVMIAVLLVLGAMAGALYAISWTLGTKPRFYALLAALAYAEFVPRLVGASIKEFIPLLTGNLNLWGEEIPTGIAPIFSEFDVPLLLQFLLARIELFHLWSFALVAIAVRFVVKVSSERAMLITLIYWCVCILAVTSVVSSWRLISESVF